MLSSQNFYEKDYLNIPQRELGGLEDEVFMWSDKFRLESKEEFENTLGYTTERKFYFNFYFYETETDRQYALKNWMENLFVFVWKIYILIQEF